MTQDKTDSIPSIKWAVPLELGIPADPLRLRLDFHHQATVMTLFEGDNVKVKMVDAMDVAHALASDLSFGTGLLPPRTIWWQNTRGGPLFAIYEEPRMRVLTLDAGTKTPLRFNVPLPGLIFLCSPGQPPWAFAVKKKPTKETDVVYRAPLANLFNNGRSCPGSHKYPQRVADMAESFFVSFFSPTADLKQRSKKFPENILHLWKHLDAKKVKKFPVDDLIIHGTIAELMIMIKD